MDICLIMFGTNMVWMIYPFQTMFWMGMSDMVHQLLGYPIFGQTYTKPQLVSPYSLYGFSTCTFFCQYNTHLSNDVSTGKTACTCVLNYLNSTCHTGFLQCVFLLLTYEQDDVVGSKQLWFRVTLVILVVFVTWQKMGLCWCKFGVIPKNRKTQCHLKSLKSKRTRLMEHLYKIYRVFMFFPKTMGDSQGQTVSWGVIYLEVCSTFNFPSRGFA